MDIRAAEEANETYCHPLIRSHPETGQLGIYGCMGYIIGIEGMPQAQAEELLFELHSWQTQERFQYRHKWQKDMLVMWDNRSVLHMATGGYDGSARYLHRTTIGERT
jgi:taurine dioxygenase